MMAFIQGTVLRVDGDSCIVLNAGIGFKIFSVGFIPESGQELALFLFEKLREDHRELYGFLERDAQVFFERMIEINGVGPKLAQKILNAGKLADITHHILSGDIGFLTGLPGVGKKTAQKIILELKGVLVDEEGMGAEDADLSEALLSLGYSRRDCEAIFAHIRGETPEDRLRHALKLLSV